MPNLISLDALVERNRIMRRVFPMLLHVDNVNKSGQTMQCDWLPLALIDGDIVS
jgi:hypothetical protein